MIKISVRFPDDHPIKDTLTGQRSERIRELVEMGLKMEQRNDEVLLQLEEIKRILERVHIEPAASATNYTSEEKVTQNKNNKITFDFDAFSDI